MLSELALCITVVAAISLTALVAIVFVVKKWQNRTELKQQNERDIFHQAADLANQVRTSEEKFRLRMQEPSRVRRQLAADLLFPGVYTSATDYGFVHNWIDTGTYTRGNPLHLLLIRKVKQLEAEERADDETAKPYPSGDSQKRPG